MSKGNSTAAVRRGSDAVSKQWQPHERRRAMVRCVAFVEPFEPRRLLSFASAGGPINPQTIGHAQVDFDLGGIVADASRNLVYLGDATANSIRVIDTDQARQVATVQLAGQPWALALSGDHKSVIVSLPFEKKVQVISTQTLTSQRVLSVNAQVTSVAGATGGKFYGLVDNGTFYADPDAQYRVAQFDIVTGKGGPSMDTLRYEASELRTDTTGKRLFVLPQTYGFRSQVRRYDVARPASPKAIAPLHAGLEPDARDLFADSTAGKTYVARAETSLIDVYDSDDGSLTRFAPIDDSDSLGSAFAIAGLPGGSLIYAHYWSSDAERSTLVAFNASSGAIEHRTPLPMFVYSGLAITPNGRSVFYSMDEDSIEETQQTVSIVGAPTLRMTDSPVIIEGQVFHDLNRNGVRDVDEGGFAEDEFFVYADLNNNGRYDSYNDDRPTEPSDLIYDGAVNYQLVVRGHSTGTFTIRTHAVWQSGDYPIVATNAAALHVTASGDGGPSQLNIALHKGVFIRGRVFADSNGDGIPKSERPVAGVVAYLDVNNDGQRQPLEPAGSTKAGTGRFSFAAPAGPGVVRILNPKKYTLTTPLAQSINATSGKIYSLEWGIRTNVAVSGRIWADTDGDGVRDAREPWKVNARVWLDTNNNRRFNKGEPTATSNAEGRYVIGLADWPTPTQPTLRARDASARLLPVGTKTASFSDWNQTLKRDLGVFAPITLRLSVFNDWDGDGKRDRGEPASPYTQLMIDEDKHGVMATDANGELMFRNLRPGRHSIRLLVPIGRLATTPSRIVIDVKEGQTKAVAFGMKSEYVLIG